MPCDSYMVVSKLLFTHAPDDVPDLEEIKTLIKDIFDVRQAKLRTAIDAILTGHNQADGGQRVSFSNLTQLEVNTARPFLPYATDLVARLERVFQQHTSNINDSHSISHLSTTYWCKRIETLNKSFAQEYFLLGIFISRSISRYNQHKY